jgi:uncharacterized protein (TIGR00725 family)
MLAKTNKIIKKVAFFGDAEAKKTDQHFIDAYNTAKLLAENGYIILNGGGPGVMLASTLGAKAGGGKVEVVIMKHKKVENFEGENNENLSLADKIVRTKNYPERLNKLVEIGEAFVIFNGGVGTLSEIGLTWIMAKFEYGEHEPLIFFGENMANLVKEMKVGLDLNSLENRLYQIVYTSEEVLKTIKNRKGSKLNEKRGFLERVMDFLK